MRENNRESEKVGQITRAQRWQLSIKSFISKRCFHWDFPLRGKIENSLLKNDKRKRGFLIEILPNRKQKGESVKKQLIFDSDLPHFSIFLLNFPETVCI